MLTDLWHLWTSISASRKLCGRKKWLLCFVLIGIYFCKAKKLMESILNLHVEQFHQSREGPHIEQQKYVVSHPVLYLHLRAALSKGP